MRKGINKSGFPTTTGVYKIKNSDNPEIEVYEYPEKGLCCCSEDNTSLGGDDEEGSCHIPVQLTGLEFITKLRDLD